MDIWYFAEKSSNGGLDASFEHCASALKRLSELKCRRNMEEHRMTMLNEYVTDFSIQLPNPSTNTAFLLLRQEASKAIKAVKQTVH